MLQSNQSRSKASLHNLSGAENYRAGSSYTNIECIHKQKKCKKQEKKSIS